MPAYDLKCPSGHVFEKTVPVDERNSQRCAVCKDGPCEVVIGVAPNVIFRGGGWTRTDAYYDRWLEDRPRVAVGDGETVPDLTAGNGNDT